MKARAEKVKYYISSDFRIGSDIRCYNPCPTKFIFGGNAQHNNATQYSIAAIESSFSGRGQPATKIPISAPRKSSITLPTTNVSIGMDPWNSSVEGPVPVNARPIATVASPGAVSTAMVRHEEPTPGNQWIHDERELKRLKRKQSNRESARRSRLRK